MRRSTVFVVLVALLGISGCSDRIGYNQPAGAVLGGVAGGLLGSRVGSGSGRLAATAAGALLGAAVGGEAGRSLDKADVLYERREVVAPAQVPIPYTPPSASYAPPVTPVTGPVVTPVSGPRNCQMLAGAPGTPQQYACQSTDGTWFIAR